MEKEVSIEVTVRDNKTSVKAGKIVSTALKNFIGKRVIIRVKEK